MSNDHRSPSHVRAPAPTAPASTSSTMNGSPSDQVRTYSTTPLGTSSEPRQAAVIRPRSSVASASSSRTVAVRAACRPCSRRSAAAGLLRPHGRDAQHGLGAERVDEVLEHGERLLVRPVDVLEHQQHGGLAGHRGEEPHHSLGEHHERLVGRLAGRPPLRQQPAERGPERRQLREVGQSLVAEVGEQRLGERPERHRYVGLHRPAEEHLHAGLARGGDDLAHQPRLADPGLPADEDHASGTSLRPRPAPCGRCRAPDRARSAPDTEAPRTARVSPRSGQESHERPIGSVSRRAASPAAPRCRRRPGAGPCCA